LEPEQSLFNPVGAVPRSSVEEGKGFVSRPYVRSEDRRKQIVEVALRLVSEHGVQGTTLNRIAAGVGMTTAGLYGHFPSRKDILLEAMDAVCERVRDLHHSASNPNALERLREIGVGHTRMVSAADGFAVAFFEFIAAPPDEGLREALGVKELMLIEDLAEIVREGQVQGSIRNEADPYQVAWTLVSRAWTEDVSYLMGIASHWNDSRSKRMLDDILESIAEPDGERSA
jgi:AcrR family transcriptional regulator